MRAISTSSAGGVGGLLSAFFWSYALLQMPAGWLVDRFGMKWTYAVAFSGVVAGLPAGVGLARTFGRIFALRVLLGVGDGQLRRPPAFTFIKRHSRGGAGFPDRRLRRGHDGRAGYRGDAGRGLAEQFPDGGRYSC